MENQVCNNRGVYEDRLLCHGLRDGCQPHEQDESCEFHGGLVPDATTVLLFLWVQWRQKKGVAYRVWRMAIQEGLHVPEVIVEPIHKSLQREAKNKIVGSGSGTSVEQILQQLDQFYGDDGASVPGIQNMRSRRAKKSLRSLPVWTIRSGKPRIMAPTCCPMKKPLTAICDSCFGKDSRKL